MPTPEPSEESIFDLHPTFLLISDRKHWVDRVLRAREASSLDAFLDDLGCSKRKTTPGVTVQVITEEDRNYFTVGDITIGNDSAGKTTIRAFSFRAYGDKPYITFFYSSPGVIPK